MNTPETTQIYRIIPHDEFVSIKDRILYEDNHIIILNKLPGEIVQGDKTGDEPMSEMLKAFIAQKDNKPGRVYIGVPHRLDRPVSGAVIFAKTSKALSRLNKSFKDGELTKKYWALLENCPNPKIGELTNYLSKNERNNKSYIVSKPSPSNKDKNIKEAKLKYQLIAPTQKYFLVEIELLTGRHHQIRCQMAGINCPIKGDLKYGAKRSNKDGSISLHAHTISFIHPTKKTRITITAPTYMEDYILKK